MTVTLMIQTHSGQSYQEPLAGLTVAMNSAERIKAQGGYWHVKQEAGETNHTWIPYAEMKCIKVRVTE